MQDETFRNICKFISEERLRAHAHADHRRELAANSLMRYSWNMALCEAFYPTLHLLEVGLRNATDNAMSMKLGKNWLTDPRVFTLHDREFNKREEAITAIQGKGLDATRGRIIAELPFSFWTGLLSPVYDPAWHGGVLKNTFPGLSGAARRRAIPAERFELIRTFRNKVFHHNRILHIDLEVRHTQIMQAIGWLDKDFRRYASCLDRFPLVFKYGDAAYGLFHERIDNPKPNGFL